MSDMSGSCDALLEEDQLKYRSSQLLQQYHEHGKDKTINEIYLIYDSLINYKTMISELKQQSLSTQNSINQLLPFQLTLTELNPMTRYYARSFVKNEKGVSYGNVVTFRTCDKEIGQEYQGGNIYYILQPGDFGYDSLQCHGLICCNYSFTSNLAFSDVNYFNGAISKSIGSGKSNTDLIINNQGDDAKAAAYCSKFDIGGYDDWFLPSLNELERLLESQVNMPINSDYSFYVSSTEDNEYNVFISQLQDVSLYYYYYNNNIKPNQQLIKTVRSSVYYKNAYYYQTAWPVRMF
jgi:hypothetical protein